MEKNTMIPLLMLLVTALISMTLVQTFFEKGEYNEEVDLSTIADEHPEFVYDSSYGLKLANPYKSGTFTETYFDGDNATVENAIAVLEQYGGGDIVDVTFNVYDSSDNIVSSNTVDFHNLYSSDGEEILHEFSEELEIAPEEYLELEVYMER